MNRRLLLALGLLAVAVFLWTRKGQEAVSRGETRIMEAVNSFSERAVALLKNLELYKPKPYRDAGGWSIGYGHFMGPVATLTYLSPEDANRLLYQDMEKSNALIARYVKVPLNQNQYDAIVSAIHNLGAALFVNTSNKGPTRFIKKLNAGDYQGAADELSRFVYTEGRVSNALVNRRRKERSLFLGTEV